MLSTGQFLLKLNTLGAILAHNSVADSDLELKGGGEGGGGEVGCFVLFALLAAFLPSVISSFSTQNKGGEAQDPGPLT